MLRKKSIIVLFISSLFILILFSPNICAEGNINKEIANKLNLSERTIHSHWRNIFFKLEINTKLEAVVYCIKNELIRI